MLLRERSATEWDVSEARVLVVEMGEEGWEEDGVSDEEALL